METFLVVKEVSLMTYLMWIDTKAESAATVNILSLYLLIGHYFVSLFVKISPVFWMWDESQFFIIVYVWRYKDWAVTFQLNQSGHSEYDSEYVDIEGDDEITQGGMVRSRSLSICRVQFVKGKWKNNLNVYGSLMTVLLSKWLAYWANVYQIIWAMISFIRVPV